MSEELGFELRSTVTEDDKLTLSLRETAIPEPGDDQVIVKVEATPINPSDLALLLAPADLSTGVTTGSGKDTVFTADIQPVMKKMVKPRVGKALRVGNEGAGTVIAAGKSEGAQALLGKTVSGVGGAMYSQYRCMHFAQCMELNPGTTAKEGASSFVNPLTALGMVENMRMDNCKALIHTAAASNLGQMLNRICQADGVDLINIVRKQEQVDLLKSMGAKYVVNSSDETFKKDLTEAIIETEAYIAFDATGGGRLTGDILTCMELAASRNSTDLGPYGSDVHKRVYIYGGLSQEPTSFNRNFGFSWSISGWLLTPFLGRIGMEATQRLQKRVRDEIKTTFASHYSKEVSLEQAMQAEEVRVYGKITTGEKYLINPSL